MAIRGAIFDCDGTILDSMPMWESSCVGLLERYGVPDARRVFLEHESLDMDKKCYWYHDNLGIGQSGDALYQELWADVERAYARSVRPYPGCRVFLQGLRDQGVPCVVVSSTPTSLVRAALASHGLDGFFDELLFVGDLGRGKEHSDCYLGAARLLGTPRDETWVFEDAPFGIRSAVRGGLPTVAILNDHDGRDEAFVRTWATCVWTTYEGRCPQDLEGMSPSTLDALVVAGSPEPSSPELVAQLTTKADYVVAADAGVGPLAAAGVAPHVYCGDQDSTARDVLSWATASASRVERHPVEKDDTDLGLAITCAREEADRRGSALRLTLTCASGGRPDHALAVFGVLARNADARPRLVEDGFECRILSPLGEHEWRIEAPAGTTVSTIALAPGTRVTERGMRWELADKPLELLGDLGVSNRNVADGAFVRCERGVLAVFIING